MSSPQLELGLEQLRFERAQLLEAQRLLEQELERADEDAEGKQATISELEDRLRRQQQKLERTEEQARELEHRFSQLASEYSDLSLRTQSRNQVSLTHRSLPQRRQRCPSLNLEWDPSSDIATSTSSFYSRDTGDEDEDGWQSEGDQEDEGRSDVGLCFFGDAREDLFVSAAVSPAHETVPAADESERSITQPTLVTQARESQDARVEFQLVQDRLDEQQAEIERLQRTLFNSSPSMTRHSALSLVAESLETLRPCVHCGGLFTSEERLPCPQGPRKHPGHFGWRDHGGAYTCCGASAQDASGCLQLPHQDALPLRPRLPSSHAGGHDLLQHLSYDQDEIFFDASTTITTIATTASASPERQAETEVTCVTLQSITETLRSGGMAIEPMLAKLMPSFASMERKVQNTIRARLRTLLFDLESTDSLYVNIKDDQMMFHLKSTNIIRK